MPTTKITVDGRAALRVERRLPHAPERVWRAVSDPAEMERWFVATVPLGPTEGEEFEAYGETGRILVVDPPRRLEWTFGIEHYWFELTPDGDAATTLVFVHVFNPDLGPGERHAAGWDVYFHRLDVHLDGGFISEEDAHAQAADRREHDRGPISGSGSSA